MFVCLFIGTLNPNKQTNKHSVLSTFLLSVATSLQYLRMEFSYNNSYVMPELRRLFCTTLHFLQLGLKPGCVATRSKSSLQKFYCRHHELVDRYGVSTWSMRTDQHVIVSLSSTLDLTIISKSAGVSRKAEEACPTGAPGPCSQFLVESELLIFFCYFVHVCIILVILCSLLCVSVFHVLSLFPDYIILIFRKNLDSLDYSFFVI